MGEEAKGNHAGKPYLAWLVGGENWHVVRDADDGDVEVISYVPEGRKAMRIHDGTVYVTRTRGDWPGKKTRPFCVLWRIDDVVFGPVPVAPRAEPTGWDVFGRVVFGFLAAAVLLLAAFGICKGAWELAAWKSQRDIDAREADKAARRGAR